MLFLFRDILWIRRKIIILAIDRSSLLRGLGFESNPLGDENELSDLEGEA